MIPFYFLKFSFHIPTKAMDTSISSAKTAHFALLRRSFADVTQRDDNKYQTLKVWNIDAIGLGFFGKQSNGWWRGSGGEVKKTEYCYHIPQIFIITVQLEAFKALNFYDSVVDLIKSLSLWYRHLTMILGWYARRPNYISVTNRTDCSCRVFENSFTI